MTTAPTELKPCPFCAGPVKMIRPMGDRVFNWDTQGKQVPPYYGPRWFRVVCANENCHVVTRACSTEREAIAKWNTRAPALEPQAVDDAMVERGELSVADALVALTAAIAREDRESQIKYQALATIAVNIEKSEPTAEFAMALKAWWGEEKAKIYPSRAALQAAKEPSNG